MNRRPSPRPSAIQHYGDMLKIVLFDELVAALRVADYYCPEGVHAKNAALLAKIDPETMAAIKAANQETTT